MATIKQIDANRRNAELSTGPSRRKAKSAPPPTPPSSTAPSPPDSNENQDWRIGSSIANAHSRFDLLQRRINATEHNFHRSLKALQPSKPPRIGFVPAKSSQRT